jgi:hypothetical protein
LRVSEKVEEKWKDPDRDLEDAENGLQKMRVKGRGQTANVRQELASDMEEATVVRRR